MICNENLNVLRLHDSLTKEIKNRGAFYNSKEPIPLDNFFPTYKKIERRPENFDSTDLEKHYLTVFKKPWYKRSMVVEKIPAFTDRIFVHSMNCFADDVVPVQSEDGRHQYGCFEPDFVGSDHSPIFALMNIKFLLLDFEF
ncbi:hypothetical protein MHBO_005139 [Bonamia ostreae]|uniref:Inositol polyphosphate-related phosphatase domain-containing protein n=1 Tax=Bonamia ostreae TaxID=126728 RepID=A0ABV2AVU7_9EUKA